MQAPTFPLLFFRQFITLSYLGLWTTSSPKSTPQKKTQRAKALCNKNKAAGFRRPPCFQTYITKCPFEREQNEFCFFGSVYILRQDLFLSLYRSNNPVRQRFQFGNLIRMQCRCHGKPFIQNGHVLHFFLNELLHQISGFAGPGTIFYEGKGTVLQVQRLHIR